MSSRGRGGRPLPRLHPAAGRDPPALPVPDLPVGPLPVQPGRPPQPAACAADLNPRRRRDRPAGPRRAPRADAPQPHHRRCEGLVPVRGRGQGRRQAEDGDHLDLRQDRPGLVRRGSECEDLRTTARRVGRRRDHPAPEHPRRSGLGGPGDLQLAEGPQGAGHCRRGRARGVGWVLHRAGRRRRADEPRLADDDPRRVRRRDRQPEGHGRLRRRAGRAVELRRRDLRGPGRWHGRRVACADGR